MTNENASGANNPALSRRAVLTGAMAMTATPILAAPVLSLPALASPYTPGVMEAGLIATCEMSATIAERCMPDGAWLRGLSFRCIDGKIDRESIWATAILPDFGLTHMRPAVYRGWRAERIVAGR